MDKMNTIYCMQRDFFPCFFFNQSVQCFNILGNLQDIYIYIKTNSRNVIFLFITTKIIPMICYDTLMFLEDEWHDSTCSLFLTLHLPGTFNKITRPITSIRRVHLLFLLTTCTISYQSTLSLHTHLYRYMYVSAMIASKISYFYFMC